MARTIEIWTKEGGYGKYTIETLPLGLTYHREDGPAFIETNGNKRVEIYFWEDENLTKEEFTKKVIQSKMNLL